MVIVGEGRKEWLRTPSSEFRLLNRSASTAKQLIALFALLSNNGIYSSHSSSLALIVDSIRQLSISHTTEFSTSIKALYPPTSNHQSTSNLLCTMSLFSFRRLFIWDVRDISSTCTKLSSLCFSISFPSLPKSFFHAFPFLLSLSYERTYQQLSYITSYL